MMKERSKQPELADSPNSAGAVAQEFHENGNGHEGEDGHRTVHLLKRIKSGAISPQAIGADDRLQLVGYLLNEGYSAADIAEILQVSDRTIERDKKEIREQNALPRDPKMVERHVGRLVLAADLSIQRIRKALREKDVPVAIRVEGEHRSFQIERDLVDSLRHLGYLPTATQRVEANMTHNLGELPDLRELQIEAHRVVAIGQQNGVTGEQQESSLKLAQIVDGLLPPDPHQQQSRESTPPNHEKGKP